MCLVWEEVGGICRRNPGDVKNCKDRTGQDKTGQDSTVLAN